MVATTAGCLREWKRVYIYFFFQFFFSKDRRFHNAENEKWYEHEHQTVALGSKPTLVTQMVRTGLGTRLTTSQSCQDMQILTASEIKANKADIVIKNKQEKSCLLIDMSNPIEKNTSVKVTEKLSKNKDLEIEIETMWGMKATTIPLVTGVLRLTKKGLEKYIRCTTNPGEHQNT